MEFEEAAVEKIVRIHLDFIKSRGEKGRSAMTFLATFEKWGQDEPNVLGTLRAEHSVIEALASAMKAEIERMEEES